MKRSAMKRGPSAAQLEHREAMDDLRPRVFARDLHRCQAPSRLPLLEARWHDLGRSDVPFRLEYLRGFAALCWPGSIAPHHIWRRGQGGPDTMENLVTLCDPHHTWVHQNIEWARAMELLR